MSTAAGCPSTAACDLLATVVRGICEVVCSCPPPLECSLLPLQVVVVPLRRLCSSVLQSISSRKDSLSKDAACSPFWCGERVELC